MYENWANWKTVGNNGNYDVESEHPILKKDEHHAEIIDITDGLVVEEASMIDTKYELENHEVLRQDNIWGAFSKAKWSENSNLNERYI